jgi:predicted dehydrogenase
MESSCTRSPRAKLKRARLTAQRFGIPRVHESYEALLADTDLDAVYIPPLSALHARWSAAALDAGKHVLVEKPFTSSLGATETLAAHAAWFPELILAEAYHTGHHPIMDDVRAILDANELGVVRHASATFSIPIFGRSDLRWNYELGGGGLLDVGYYPVRFLRELFGPAQEFVSARAKMRGDVDRFLEAELDFGGVRGTVVSGVWSARLGIGVEIVGDTGRLRVRWPYHPQSGAHITIAGASGRSRQTVDRTPSYSLQLAAFRDAVRGDVANRTDAVAAVAQPRTLDAIQRRAGMRPRPSVPLIDSVGRSSPSWSAHPIDHAAAHQTVSASTARFEPATSSISISCVPGAMLSKSNVTTPETACA